MAFGPALKCRLGEAIAGVRHCLGFDQKLSLLAERFFVFPFEYVVAGLKKAGDFVFGHFEFVSDGVPGGFDDFEFGVFGVGAGVAGQLDLLQIGRPSKAGGDVFAVEGVGVGS